MINDLDDGLIMQVGDGKVGSNPINLTQEQSADYWYNNGLGRGYKPNKS